MSKIDFFECFGAVAAGITPISLAFHVGLHPLACAVCGVAGLLMTISYFAFVNWVDAA